VRVPAPAGLLLEHPAVPVPTFDRENPNPSTCGEAIAQATLSRREKLSIALQLTAAASLMAEFDLWPGRASIRDARFVRNPSGVRTILAGFPIPMSRVFSRLGGGEGAAATTRTAVLEAISEVVGLSITTIDDARGEPGFFLERAIARQLRAFKPPLDSCTARALWAFRWDGLPTPEEGATNFWNVRLPETACRLAGALWASINRRRGAAWLRATGEKLVDDLQDSERNTRKTLIVVGEASRQELAEVSRWTERNGCSAVVIGLFPSGWYPPNPPAFDGENLYRHLAVAGMPLEEARRIVEQRHGRFDPLDPTDRRALTESARWVFAPATDRRQDTRFDDRQNQLRRILALSPDGLPTTFITRHCDLSRQKMEQQSQHLGIVRSDDRWRLAEAVPLEPDPQHLEVAKLFDKDTPKRWLHAALGDGDSEDLREWTRSRLDELDGYAVRDLLVNVLPGALGRQIEILVAEACLSIRDLSGARRALAAMPGPDGDALSCWLEALDNRSDIQLQLPEDGQLEVSPRAVAEAAILVLNSERRKGGGRKKEASRLIELGREQVAPLIRRRIDIDLAWIRDGNEFDDPQWRRRVVGSSPALRAHYAHRRALQLMDRGQPQSVRRLLELLTDDRMGPGFLGLIEHDLGATALDEGRSFDADRHQLRAYRLLQAAGYQNVTRRVLFNLAVSDLDQLEIVSAQRRFREIEREEPGGPYMVGELARLALARGQLVEFRGHLAALESMVDENNPRFSEGLYFLRGVARLFDGELGHARRCLQRAGQEGESWTGLIDTIAGRDAGSWRPDGWGVGLAAEILHDTRVEGGRIPAIVTTGKMTRSQALALALAEHLSRARLSIGEDVRVRSVGVLRHAQMDGWANVLVGGSDRIGGIVEALAEVVERSGPEDLTPDLVTRMLAALGVSGLELRSASDARLLWRIGSGAPGSGIRQGRIVVVPLGGEAHEGPTWRLLTGILELFAPVVSTSTDPQVEETGFYGVSAAARTVRRELCELGPTHLPILLEGETGVGKEVAARALHRLSKRRGAFVPVNIAAIPANLLEAELFGSVKGAFTGADRSRQGLAVTADGGTLFLDEVGDLDPPLQVKLLRFLESQEVRAVGAAHSRQVDVRILSATHRNLDRRVKEGGFRQDLYFRIAAPALTIPPLRERREDIGLLRELFEREAENRYSLKPGTWSGEAESLIRRYRWPGNVRELRQAIEVALVRARGGVVLPKHLPIATDEIGPSGTWEEAQREFRRKFLKAALERNGGNRSATARELGISRQALLYHIKNLGLGGGSR
jgi:transcriptional regulator with AAA-type ATPase domain